MLSRSAILIIAGAVFAASAPAQAQDTAQAGAGAAQAPTAVQKSDDAAGPAALSDEALGQLRGGESLVVTNQTLVAITSGNVITGDYAAGNVSISDNALSNFNGLGNLLINTGAQVSLQTGMNVTINVNQ
ncbi:MAG TPA: hypothetical protein VFM42_08390 [Sphingomicrobium sp.]|nr:hypothetical protein [Sphingomicrobium sp.]